MTPPREVRRDPRQGANTTGVAATGTTALRHRALAAYGAVGVIGLLYAVTLLYSRANPLVYDEAVYLQIAERITETGCPLAGYGGGGPFMDNPPAVTYASALARMGGGDDLQRLRWAHVTLWALPAYAAVWLLAWSMFGRWAGVLAVASLYSQQRFILEASEVKLDVPLASVGVLFLLMLFRWCNAETGTRRSWYAPACAALAAIACLTKHQGALVPITGVVYLLVRRWLDRAPGTRLQPPYPELWVLGGAAAAGALWLGVGTLCGGDFSGAILSNLRRVSFQSNESWFHRPLLEFWQALGATVTPVLVGGFAAATPLWRSKLITDRRLLLLVLSLVLTFVFCSAIGLRNERYFLPAVPVLAVLVGSLGCTEAYAGCRSVARWPSLQRGLPLIFSTGIVLATLPQLPQIAATLARLEQMGERSNAYYRTLGALVRQHLPADERVLLSRVQTAYIADRNYYLSEYEVDGSVLVALLSNPANRITLIAYDSPQMFHPEMPGAEQQKVRDYIEQHFASLPGLPRGTQLYRRVSW